MIRRNLLMFVLTGTLVFSVLQGIALAKAVELSYVDWEAPGSLAAKTSTRLVEQFNEKHPEVSVKVRRIGLGEYRAKLMVEIAGGVAPDVLRIPYEFVDSFIQAGVLQGLDSYIERSEDLDWDDFIPPAKEAVSYGGTTYGLPFDLSAQWMGYVPDNFSAVGLEDPIELYRRGNWDWDTLETAAHKMTRTTDDGEITRIGMIIQLDEIMGQPWLYQTGTTPFTDDRTAPQLTDPRIVEAVRFLQTLLVDQRTALPAWSQPAANPGNGQFGVWPQWLSIPYFLAPLPFDSNIVPAVNGPVGNVTTGHIHSVSVIASSPHLDYAWELAQFMTSKDALLTYIEAGFAPVRRSVIPDYVQHTSGTMGFSGAELLLRDIERFRLYQVTANWDEARSIIRQGLDPVWRGEESPVTALEKIQEKLSAVLSE